MMGETNENMGLALLLMGLVTKNAILLIDRAIVRVRGGPGAPAADRVIIDPALGSGIDKVVA
jgi:hypothetical protein